MDMYRNRKVYLIYIWKYTANCKVMGYYFKEGRNLLTKEEAAPFVVKIERTTLKEMICFLQGATVNYYTLPDNRKIMS